MRRLVFLCLLGGSVLSVVSAAPFTNVWATGSANAYAYVNTTRGGDYQSGNDYQANATGFYAGAGANANYSDYWQVYYGDDEGGWYEDNYVGGSGSAYAYSRFDTSGGVLDLEVYAYGDGFADYYGSEAYAEAGGSGDSVLQLQFSLASATTLDVYSYGYDDAIFNVWRNGEYLFSSWDLAQGNQDILFAAGDYEIHGSTYYGGAYLTLRGDGISDAVPEPTTLAVLGLGALAIRRRKARNQ